MKMYTCKFNISIYQHYTCFRFGPSFPYDLNMTVPIKGVGLFSIEITQWTTVQTVLPTNQSFRSICDSFLLAGADFMLGPVGFAVCNDRSFPDSYFCSYIA